MEDSEFNPAVLKAKVRVCLPFPDDRLAVNAYNLYETSYQSELFLSEEGRSLYAEFFDFTGNQYKTEEKTDDIEDETNNESNDEANDETNDESNDKQSIIYNPETLRSLAIYEMVYRYKGGPIDPRVNKDDQREFGKRLSIEKDLAELVELDNDTFWKRVAASKSRDKIRVILSRDNINTDWKAYGIESKLIELIENVKVEDFLEDSYESICKTVKDFVYCLDIKQLQPIRDVTPHPLNPHFQIINQPAKECHHISLYFLGYLDNLTELSIKYGVDKLGIGYQKRFFEISYDDADYLASGLKKLKKLEVFRMRESILDDRKLKILLKGLEKCPIKTLEFSFCRLGDDSGKSLGKFLMLNNNVKNLELQGNDFHADGMKALGYGLQNYEGEIYYLNLSRNPLGEEGVLNIGGGLNNTNNVKKLDLSGIDISHESAHRVTQIIAFHEPLQDCNISSIPLGVEGGDKLIEILEDCYHIIRLECRACGFDENQDHRIRLMLERNKFYYENPCMNKNYFTKEDAAVIDEWTKRIKHPILLKVISISNKRKSVVKEKKYYENTIPDFIPLKAHVQKSNTELLYQNFLDTTNDATDDATNDATNDDNTDLDSKI